MIKITNPKLLNNKIKEYFNTYLFDITSIDISNKKLFMIHNNNNIIGSFFIDNKYNILEMLYLIKSERGKGYSKIIISFIKDNLLNNKKKYIYFDVDSVNVIAVKAYEKYLKFYKILPHDIFYKIYKFELKKDKIIYRFILEK